jgi:hypothetical protein
MALQKFFLLSPRQFAIMRNPFVLAARDKIKEVFFEVRAGTGDSVHFVLANHFRERNAKFSSAHCPGERDHHFPASLEMRGIRVGGIFDHCRIKVTEMPINELADAACLHFINSSGLCLSIWCKTYTAIVKR